MGKNIRSILFTNARDEKNIVEWIAHHQNLGFTHIHVFDHKSMVPIKSLIKDVPRITIEKIEEDIFHGFKMKLMMYAAKMAKGNKYDWMLYLDADEFLILPQHENVTAFLKEFRSKEYTQIGVNWLCFGSNHHNENPKGTMLESYTKCESAINDHIKCFVRPECPLSAGNPHYYQTIESIIHDVDKEGHVLGPFIPRRNRENLNRAAYVAHYIFQSFETYKQRKMSRRRDDDGESWNDFWKIANENQLHGFYNNVENTFPKDRYNEKNKETIKEITQSNAESVATEESV